MAKPGLAPGADRTKGLRAGCSSHS